MNHQKLLCTFIFSVLSYSFTMVRLSFLVPCVLVFCVCVFTNVTKFYTIVLKWGKKQFKIQNRTFFSLK